METTFSSFVFEITQTTKVLLYKIEKGNGKRWIVEKNKEKNSIFLRELDHPENFSEVFVLSDALQIVTVRGYAYLIQDKEGDGAEVTFQGPVNALLAQSLLPRMTYVTETLRGMSSDMQDYVPIDEYMATRDKRHNGVVNPQDKFGWRVNMRFNNELAPWLPPCKGGTRVPKKKKSRKFSR